MFKHPLALVVMGAMFVAGAAAWSQGKRGWSVPGTTPLGGVTVQYSDEPVVPSRMVAFRAKYGELDPMGRLRVYPVVRTPSGKLLRGFERVYEARTLGDRFIAWSFPGQFRHPNATRATEPQAELSDYVLSGGDAKALLPAGIYEVKWVFNQRLIDTGDSFRYTYRETRTP